MIDHNEGYRRAAVHETGHAFAAFLVSGLFGGVEIKNGDGRCWTRYPEDWQDRSDARFLIYSALVDSAGIEAEQLVMGHADAKAGAQDLEDLRLTCEELRELGAFKEGTITDLQAFFREAANHLLREHRDALEHLAAKAYHRMDWLGGDLHTALLTQYPQYREHIALLEGYGWGHKWVALLDAMNGEREERLGWVNPAALRRTEAQVSRQIRERGSIR